MTCEILVKPGQSGFIATVLGLPGCTVQAPTRDEAIEKARQQAEDWLAEGGEIVKVEINVPHAYARGAGIFANESEESWNAFQAAMREYREQLNADTNQL